MRTWNYVLSSKENVEVSGIRNDGLAFFVKAPMGRAELDTFLRDDCTCSVREPRCTFHQGLFFNIDMKEEVPV